MEFSDIAPILIVLVLLFVGFIYFVTTKGAKSEWKKKAALKLAELEPLINSNEIHQMKGSLMEIDKLLDYVLKNAKFKGETMGDRLKSAQKFFKWEDYQQIWETHKLRNKLAHEIDYQPKPDDLKDAYRKLKIAIQKFI